MAAKKNVLTDVAELKKKIYNLSNENNLLKSKIQQLENSILNSKEKKNAELTKPNLEEQLSIREKMFGTYFENAIVGVCMVSLEGRFLAVNKIVRNWLGYSREEMLKLKFNDITYDADKEKGNKSLQKLIKGEIENTEIEKRYLTKEQKVFWAIVSTGIVRNPEFGQQYLVTYIQNINERKFVQKELEKSVSLLKSSLESTADGILVVDNIGNVVEFNQRFIEMWNIPEAIVATRDDKKIISSILDQLIEPEIFLSKVNELYHNHSLKSFDILNFIDGRKFERYSQPQLINGEIVGRVWSFRDVTDHAKIQEKLIQSEEKFRNAFHYAAFGMALINLKGQFIEVNPSFCDIMGYAEKELLEKTFSDITYPDDLKTGMDLSLELYKGIRDYFWLEKRYVHKNGNIIWAMLSVSAVRDNKGRTIFTVAQLQDITENKKLETGLKQSENLYRSIFEKSTDAFAILNNEGKIILESSNIEKLSGYTREERQGKNGFGLVHPDDMPIIQTIFKSISNTSNSNQSAIFRSIKKDGTIWWTEASATNLLDDPVVKGIIINYRDVTSRVLIENAIKDSEEKFRSIAEQMTDLIYITDMHGILTYLSPSAEKLFGAKNNEMEGKPFTEFLVVKDIPIAVEAFELAMNSGLPIRNLPLKMQHNNGKIFIGELNGSLYNKDGKAGTIGVIRDITSRMKAEEALLEERTLLRTIVDNLPIALYIKDSDGKKLIFNQVDLLNIGKSETEVLGKTDLELLPKEFADKTAEDDLFVLKTGNSIINNEELLINLEGNSRWLLTTKIPRKNNLGEIIGIIGMGLDITERKKAEDEIRLNNERLESLLRISQYSPGNIKELIDFALEEAIQLTESKIGFIFVYDEDSQKYLLFSWSKNVFSEYEMATPDKIISIENMGIANEVVLTRKPIIINDYNLLNPAKKGIPMGHVALEKFLSIPVIFNRKLIAIVGVANKHVDYDRTDVRQLALLMDSVWKNVDRIKIMEELVKAKEKAEESDMLKTSFLCNISHEIRTPMNAIIGFTGFLLKPNLPTQKRELYTNLVKERSYDLLRIIDDVLDISKIEVGQLKLFESEINLFDLMNQLYKYYRLKKEKEERLLNISINFTLDEKLKQIKIKIDDHRLKQILTNLLDNSFKFIKKGSIEFGCKIKTANELLFFVKDTGIGIPADKHEIIFDRFRQAEDSILARSYGGTGLGLSIIKGLLSLMNGRIWLESEENVGTTFYFEVPFNQVVEVDSSTETELEKNNIIIKSKTILVVEDDEPNLMYLGEVLIEAGVNYINAINGDEALKIFNSNPNIDLVLMDIRLPGMNGFDLTREFKKIRSEIIIIAQTAYATPDDLKLCIDAGCDDYISKPASFEKIISILGKYLV